jgi:hypothetical protein
MVRRTAKAALLEIWQMLHNNILSKQIYQLGQVINLFKKIALKK